MMNKHWRCRLAILIAAALWGTNGLYIRSLSALGLSSLTCVFLRQLTAASVLGLYLLIFKRDRFRIRLRDLWCFLGTGLVSMLFFNFCNYSAMQHTTLAVAAVLLYTAPGFVIVLSYFLFRERFTLPKLLALCLMLGGCTLVSGLLPYRGGITGVGVLYGLGAGIGYALYTVFSRFALNRGYSSATVSFYSFAFCLAGVTPLTDFGSLRAVASPQLLLLALGLGVLGCVIPYLLYTYGLTGVENGPASLMATVEPLVACLCSLLVYREDMTVWCGLGILLIFGGLVSAALPGHRAPAPSDEKSENEVHTA